MSYDILINGFPSYTKNIKIELKKWMSNKLYRFLHVFNSYTLRSEQLLEITKKDTIYLKKRFQEINIHVKIITFVQGAKTFVTYIIL